MRSPRWCVCVCKCFFFFLRQQLGLLSYKNSFVRKKTLHLEAELPVQIRARGKGTTGQNELWVYMCVCVCVLCVCALNKSMGDAVGWPSPVPVWGWFGRVNAFSQLLVHLGWSLLGSSPTLTLSCPGYRLHGPPVDTTKGWGSPTRPQLCAISTLRGLPLRQGRSLP